MAQHNARMVIGVLCLALALMTDPIPHVVGYFGAYMFGLGIGSAPEDDD